MATSDGEAVNRILLAREPLGWRLGLQRMHRLCSLLGMPQRRFASIHVVGTNGKTSVARMSAELLGARGVPAGAYLSPHILSWRERVLIGGEPISGEALVEALERAEEAAEAADRAAGEEGPVTQYELLTAAAFVAFAAAGIEVAAVEAGLGGRLDATNVIPSKVTVLTSVGLDHTQWLGGTLEEIAAEKLAVLRDHTTLICGELPPQVEPVVEREVARRHARRLEASSQIGGYPARNVALAAAAVREMLEGFEPSGRELTELMHSVPGRAELVGDDPPAIFDAAHNAAGAQALAELLPELAAGRDAVCCLAVMDDKDAAAIVAALAPVCSSFVCTEVPEEAVRGSGRPGGGSHSAESLAGVCRAAREEAEAVVDPRSAWARARELARERGSVALATGSHYLLSCLWTERHAQSS
jgi:dihydrofolate synthase/folylpolyglutamate synthase